MKKNAIFFVFFKNGVFAGANNPFFVHLRTFLLVLIVLQKGC
jgi:hypothetical protein